MVSLAKYKNFSVKKSFLGITAQKMMFSIKNFFSKCDQIRSFLRIWSHLLKKSFIKLFIFCAVNGPVDSVRWIHFPLLVLSDWVFFNIFIDRVLFRVLSDRAFYRFLSDRIVLRIMGTQVFSRVIICFMITSPEISKYFLRNIFRQK